MYAIAQAQKYKGKVHEELMYAEIEPYNTGCAVRWCDDFFHPEPFSSVEEAQSYVNEYYNRHIPQNNGKRWISQK